MELSKIAKLFKPSINAFGLCDNEGEAYGIASLEPSHKSAWRQKDLALLYQAQYQNRRCYLSFPANDVTSQNEIGTLTGNKTFQTLIIGIDLETNQLVLDECFPLIPAGLEHFEACLTVKEERSFACLKVRLTLSRAMYINGSNAYCAHIMGSSWHDDRRTNTRASFEKDRAPQIKLTIPMLSQLTGRLENLSLGGAQAIVTGVVPKAQELGSIEKMSTIDCKIEFANDLLIRCKAQLRSYKVERLPSMRAQLRLCFVQLTASDQSLLYTLVELAHCAEQRP